LTTVELFTAQQLKYTSCTTGYSL